MSKVIHLGPFHGTQTRPDYQLIAYRDGNPKRPISHHRLDLRSAVSIQTTKNLNDLSGTFQIVLKDKRARNVLREMDVIRIRLKGHSGAPLTTVFKGVVDEVTPGGTAGTSDSDEHTTISGRCPGKYLQTNSLFLPVWDADGNLPTALTFGMGDVTRKGSPAYKAGGTSPYDIFRYLVLNYVYGGKGIVGTAGTPNARHWLNYHARFERHLGFQIPFLQLNEDQVSTALQSMMVLGFTEAWVDELGRVVYRRPQWDQPARFVLHTDALQSWSFPRTDVNAATYVEVIPAGDPGIDSATAQALRAGRAPVPSSYVKTGGHATQLGKAVSEQFIIDSTRAGKPTAKGRKNVWYQRQRRLGLRPQQGPEPAADHPGAGAAPIRRAAQVLQPHGEGHPGHDPRRAARQARIQRPGARRARGAPVRPGRLHRAGPAHLHRVAGRRRLLHELRWHARPGRPRPVHRPAGPALGQDHAAAV
jgi:hypothetical protein